MKLFKKKNIQGIPLDRIKSEPIDMQGLFASIACRDEIAELYKRLCRVCHPDRFVGDQKRQERATQLFKEVQKNQTSLARLKELEEQINKELM